MGPFITHETWCGESSMVKSHIKDNWKSVYFTDERSVLLNRGSVGMCTKAKENSLLG